MKPLHDSYHNMGLWLVEERDGEYCVVYDAGKTFRVFSIIGIFCLILSAGLWYPVRNERYMWVILPIGAATCLGLAGSSWVFSTEKRKLGPIFRFQPKVGVATFPQSEISVSNAKRRLQFSYEIFRDPYGDSNCELNYFIDDERYRFLAQAGVGGPLRKLAEGLEELGFVVTAFDGPRNPPERT